ncbi:MAG: response regulator, partial [Candidatus Nitrotoga sp.]
MMNGNIDLESTPGLGSTFSITLDLPVSVTAPEQALRMPIAKAFVQKRDVSIAKSAKEGVPVALVVDDDPINRKLIAIQLGLLGLHAECVENGELALARWRDGRFALVITDCHMPVMDGYEFARALRKIEASEKRSRTPIFGWSANALAEEGERCFAADMDEFLVKPVGLTQLNDVLSRWLVVAAPAQPAHIALRESDDTQTATANFMLLDELSDNAADKAEIVRDFMSQTRSDLAELEAAVAILDFQESMRFAHRMKGASRMVGARDIAAACEEMEYAVQQGKPASADAVKAALVQLESYLAGVTYKNQSGKNQDKETGNG